MCTVVFMHYIWKIRVLDNMYELEFDHNHISISTTIVFGVVFQSLKFVVFQLFQPFDRIPQKMCGIKLGDLKMFQTNFWFTQFHIQCVQQGISPSQIKQNKSRLKESNMYHLKQGCISDHLKTLGKPKIEWVVSFKMKCIGFIRSIWFKITWLLDMFIMPACDCTHLR